MKKVKVLKILQQYKEVMKYWTFSIPDPVTRLLGRGEIKYLFGKLQISNIENIGNRIFVWHLANISVRIFVANLATCKYHQTNIDFFLTETPSINCCFSNMKIS